MRRVNFQARPDWKQQCNNVGFDYWDLPSSDGSVYWTDDAAYEFSLAQIDRLEDSTNKLHAMCMELVSGIIESGLYPPQYAFNNEQLLLIERSWMDGSPHLYGRFDLAYDGSTIKMLEYNADTPTSLLEASVVQWHWVEQVQGLNHRDQFNSIHECLIKRWQEIADRVGSTVHFAGMKDAGREDWGNIDYLMDTALSAGFNAKRLCIEDIGWNERHFTDLNDGKIATLFKLYPWEWMAKDDFAKNIAFSGINMIEPAWKMLLSNKALLPLLWEKFSGHPLLLESFFDDGKTAFDRGDWVRKPLLSREGANVTRLTDGKPTTLTGSEHNDDYDQSGYVVQKWIDLPTYDQFRPVIGSWVVGDTACGIGIREDYNKVTGNDSHFVPHYFKE